MHFSFLEKFGLSALICAWVLFLSNALGNILVDVEPHTPALAAVAPAEAPAAAPEAVAPEVPIATLLASADPAAGEKVFGKCKACHTIEQGGANKVGPNLWNVVGGPKAHLEGFAYSSAIAGMGGEWTHENLNAFLTNPKAYAPGNKMTFGGLKDAEDRAAVIAYLRANTVNPPPLP